MRYKYPSLKLLLKIWTLHIFFYYLLFGIISTFKNLQLNFELLLLIPLYPLMGGIVGYFDNIPFFFTIPIMCMLLMLGYTRYTIYQTYVYSLFICHIIRLLLLNYLNYDQMLFTDFPYGRTASFFICIVSLAAVCIFNYIIFKKTYKETNETRAKDNKI